MAKITPGRTTADVDGDVVVFLIGMRFNKLWKVHKWLPVVTAMPRMLTELFKHPDKGMLNAQTFVSGRTVMVVQYWTSFEALEHFARSADDPHLEAWRRFNARVGKNGDVGIFHETYQVPAGSHECIYANMPPFGLAKAYGTAEMSRRGQSAAKRIGARAQDDVALPVY